MAPGHLPFTREMFIGRFGHSLIIKGLSNVSDLHIKDKVSGQVESQVPLYKLFPVLSLVPSPQTIISIMRAFLFVPIALVAAGTSFLRTNPSSQRCSRFTFDQSLPAISNNVLLSMLLAPLWSLGPRSSTQILSLTR